MDGTVWLSQIEIADLFDTTKQNRESVQFFALRARTGPKWGPSVGAAAGSRG